MIKPKKSKLSQRIMSPNVIYPCLYIITTIICLILHIKVNIKHELYARMITSFEASINSETKIKLETKL